MNSFNLDDIKTLIQQSLKEEPTGDSWLDSRYDEQVAIIGHTNPYYRLFYLFTHQLKPSLTVELGAWRGDASAHFAVGNPAGRVVAVDIHKDDDVAGLAKLNEAVDRLPNMHFHRMWIVEAVDVVKSYGPIECIFFDGWHDFSHVSDDWNNYKPLLADRALCIFDDITAAYHFEGMREFWDSLPGEKYLSTEGIHGDIPMGFLIHQATNWNDEEFLDKLNQAGANEEVVKKKMGRPPKK